MPDQPETTGQPQEGSQPSSNGQQTTTTSLEGYVEKARLDGALAKIQELTLANRALAEQLTQKNEEIGKHTARIATLEAEKGQLVGQHKTAFDELNGKYGEAQKQLAEKDSLERKLKAIKSANHPELLAIIDSLPFSESDEGQLAVVNQMAQFAEGLVKRREQELLAGNTETGAGIGSAGATPPKPSTPEGWEQYINSLPLGSKERSRAFDEYWNSLNKPK